ncbi:sigma-54 dependent transcriptional regulator [Ideonella azotifigens]|uniref:Sigma-54-dependent transcriptional regulator n=1 Tax=Ideonella azotifigens TaxID=513160 RepID=A0ABP3VGL0_9BURK|nr:sigma-54 dependent transcriptional regulator [Ideonella azotifigens]MCD2342808.1 sigma-54 dependent transcriptional regulator [Ideonella azotifigens]
MPGPTERLSPRRLALAEQGPDTSPVRAKALLFHDPASCALLEQIERIGRSDASVLLIGETGTGKELVARHLHAMSARSGPFLAVNCGAFSESLIDAELFGHETGAFTGASQARAGWFEAAHGGTLFLDEIGDLPLSLQVKLLRVLQERQVVRLGSRKTLAVDVRLVAATNIDLRGAVAAQRFRADLYYRLSVATVQLPPLRDRPGDLLPLARHFVSQYGPRLKLADAVLSAEAEAALLDYSWPGNIRELENVIHFALIVCRHGVIEVSDLKLVAAVTATLEEPAIRALAPVDRLAPNATMAPAQAEAPLADIRQQQLEAALEALLNAGLSDVFQRVEATLVKTAFARTDANQVRTARALGITRNTLRTLLRRHGLLAPAKPGEDSQFSQLDDD